jgi:hypothetical protein
MLANQFARHERSPSRSVWLRANEKIEALARGLKEYNRAGRNRVNAMSEVEQLEKRVQKLSPKDLAKFRAWFIEYDSHVLDEQNETDEDAENLDGMIDDALAEYKAENPSEL